MRNLALYLSALACSALFAAVTFFLAQALALHSLWAVPLGMVLVAAFGAAVIYEFNREPGRESVPANIPTENGR